MLKSTSSQDDQPQPTLLRIAQPKADQPLIPLNPDHCRIIFREMIQAELQDGVLRHSKRRQLMDYAERLGIGEFEAGMMIAEAQCHYMGLKTPRMLTPQGVRDQLNQAKQSQLRLRNVLLVSAASIVINVLMLHWFLAGSF